MEKEEKNDKETDADADVDVDNPKDKISKLMVKTKEAIKLTISTQNSVLNKNFLKNLVSKKKLRFDKDGYDLDLSYITERIIAMGFPASSLEKLYRNSMSEVKNFFETRHSKSYKVFNLCLEKTYSIDNFYSQSYFPWEDHEAPPLETTMEFCDNIEEWLKASESNVAAIHCKAGKGRTGTMICCHLLQSGLFDTANEALEYYGKMRTENGKGVTIPSQIRYIYYYEHLLKTNFKYPAYNNLSVCKITKIKIYTVPKFHMLSNGCTPYFKINVRNPNKRNNEDSDIKKIYDYKKKNKLVQYNDNIPYIEFKVDNVEVKGDVRIDFLNKTSMGHDKMFKFWFNTFFLSNDGILSIKKSMLDKAFKDKDNKNFDPNLKVEVYFIFNDSKDEDVFEFNEIKKNII
jgi:phosphatidylinositol-3,4,5-trisphosphate 3-phosphatase/dual-specificity protein phosphatase PTEN